MRKLAIGAFSFAAAILAANYILTRATIIYAAVICAFAGALVLGVRLKSLRGLVISLLCAAIGFTVFAFHYDRTVEQAHALSGREDVFRFRLLEEPTRYDSYSSVEAQLYQDELPRLQTILYASGDALDGYHGGDLIAVRAKLTSADQRYGDRTDRYTARNIYLRANVKGAMLRLGSSHTLASLAARASRIICSCVEGVFPKDTAPFMKALLVGNKTELYRNDALYVVLSRAGLMHVVAVSGMHVSCLVALMQMLLGKSRRNAIGCMILVWCFVLITGFSPSAVRAAFMQTMLLIAPLFGRENDPITSLSAALAFLLLLNPFAIASTSLQLSFAAMLGIVLFAERIEERLMRPFEETKAEKIMRFLIGSAACSLSVMVFSLPITALTFGYMAILSPLTNLLCLPVVQMCFAGGYLCCLLSLFPVVGSAAGALLSWPVRYLFAVCRRISSISFAALYEPTWLVLSLTGLVYLSLLLVFALHRNTKEKIIVPLAVWIVSLLLSQGGLLLYNSTAEGFFTVVDVGQGQCVCAVSGQNAVVVDCGSTSFGEYQAGDSAAAYLKQRGVRQIEAVIFTHLHEDHVNGFERLANLYSIRKLVLPANLADADTQLPGILRCALEHDIPVEWIENDRWERFGDIRAMLLQPGDTGDGNERCMPVLLSVGNYDLITTGDAPSSREKALVDTLDLSQIEILVVGHHGSKTASCEEYLASIGGRKAVLSVGKNTYGLPAEETLERLAAFGYTVYRTDTDGNVEIRIHG